MSDSDGTQRQRLPEPPPAKRIQPESDSSIKWPADRRSESGDGQQVLRCRINAPSLLPLDRYVDQVFDLRTVVAFTLALGSESTGEKFEPTDVGELLVLRSGYGSPLMMDITGWGPIATAIAQALPTIVALLAQLAAGFKDFVEARATLRNTKESNSGAKRHTDKVTADVKAVRKAKRRHKKNEREALELDFIEFLSAQPAEDWTRLVGILRKMPSKQREHIMRALVSCAHAGLSLTLTGPTQSDEVIRW